MNAEIARTIDIVVGRGEAPKHRSRKTSQKRAFDSTRAINGGECQAVPDLPTDELYHVSAAGAIGAVIG
jgi:hypothetical protein